MNFLLSSSQVQLFPPVIMLDGEVGGFCPVRLVQLLLQKQVTEGSPECHSVPQHQGSKVEPQIRLLKNPIWYTVSGRHPLLSCRALMFAFVIQNPYNLKCEVLSFTIPGICAFYSFNFHQKIRKTGRNKKKICFVAMWNHHLVV